MNEQQQQDRDAGDVVERDQPRLLPMPERLVITCTPQSDGKYSIHFALEGVFDDEPRRVWGRAGQTALQVERQVIGEISDWQRENEQLLRAER